MDLTATVKVGWFLKGVDLVDHTGVEVVKASLDLKGKILFLMYLGPDLALTWF